MLLRIRKKWCPFNITSEFCSHFVCKSIWLVRIKICSSFGQFLLPQALFRKKKCDYFYFQATILANIYLIKCSSGNTRKRLKYVNNKDSSLWCRYSYLCTYFTPFSSVSFDYFEQINVFLACLKKATGSQCGLYQMFKTKRSEKHCFYGFCSSNVLYSARISFTIMFFRLTRFNTWAWIKFQPGVAYERIAYKAKNVALFSSFLNMKK